MGLAIPWQHVDKVSLRGEKTAGSNPTTDRGKPGTKKHVLTDKKGIPLSVIIASASIHDIKAVTDVIDNAIVKRPRRISFGISINALFFFCKWVIWKVWDDFIFLFHVPTTHWKTQHGKWHKQAIFHCTHKKLYLLPRKNQFSWLHFAVFAPFFQQVLKCLYLVTTLSLALICWRHATAPMRLLHRPLPFQLPPWKPTLLFFGPSPMGFSITGIVTPQPSAIKHGFKRQTQQHTHTPGTRTKLFCLTRFPPSAILTAITCGTIRHQATAPLPWQGTQP
jgi:hypothetical protein